MLRLGLRIKFFLYSNTLIVVTMCLVTFLAVVHERRTRLEAIELRGRGVCEALAIHIAEHMHPDGFDWDADEGRIERAICEIRERQPDLMRYVVVTDAAGAVTHSCSPEFLGTPFNLTSAEEASDGAWVTQILEQPGDTRILAVRTPLQVPADSPPRFLILGYSLEPIDAEVRAIALQAALVALFLMIGNSGLTAIYVETLIRPILGLNRTIQYATHGDYSVRARSRAGGEVGELAVAFNRMMDEIEETRDSEKIRQLQLAHTERMAAVGTLAAGVAHEVNNPLGGILACIENMRSNLDDREMQERYLEVITDGLSRIEHTVANLLDFSRERMMELSPNSINHSLKHVAELAEYQLREANIEVEFDLDPDGPYVMADRFQVDQLFLNLVLNALQAMPDGGRLTLRTSQKDGMVVGEVCDTGVGISDEMRERIFDPFFTTREVGEGTGLGLTVSDSIVTAHGGTLEVESAPGEGSVFRVSFPVVSNQILERSLGDDT